MSRHLDPAEPTSTLTHPEGTLVPDTGPHERVARGQARACRCSIRLLPVVALVSGYTSALASTAHVDAAASALLLLAFAALVRSGSAWRATPSPRCATTDRSPSDDRAARCRSGCVWAVRPVLCSEVAAPSPPACTGRRAVSLAAAAVAATFAGLLRVDHDRPIPAAPRSAADGTGLGSGRWP